MASLDTIPRIGKPTLELLEAAGFQDVESLAKAGVDDLVKELVRANRILKIFKRPPTRKSVEKWILQACDIAGITRESADLSSMPVNYELSEQVIPMITNAPFAIPLPARILMERQLGVADIPPAILLNRYSGDLDVRVEHRVPVSRSQKPPAAFSGNVKTISKSIQRLEIDASKLKSTDEISSSPPTRPARPPVQENNRVALLRAPKESTNKGRNPQSRWYIRGVLHSHSGSIWFGAAVTLLLLAVIPASVVAATLLLLSGEIPDTFGWVPGWLLWIPVSLPVVGIFFLIFGSSGTCRVCGQKLFVYQPHTKNSKAHHVPGLGYIIPLCFQILIFRWFRCTHCGTPIRLKE
ncbi:MAG: DUF4332 domain-containing protein [Verrucomicrobiota bacterium]